MKIKFCESSERISMGGKSMFAPLGFVPAVKSVAERHGIEIAFLGWDMPYPHEVELTEAHKSEVQDEMRRIAARAEKMNARRCAARRCAQCGTRSGMYTTSRTVCDDCAAE